MRGRAIHERIFADGEGHGHSVDVMRRRTRRTTSSYRSLFCHTSLALDAAVNFNSLHVYA